MELGANPPFEVQLLRTYFISHGRWRHADRRVAQALLGNKSWIRGRVGAWDSISSFDPCFFSIFILRLTPHGRSPCNRDIFDIGKSSGVGNIHHRSW